LAKLATLFSAVSGGSAMKQRPTVIVSSETEFDLYDSLLAPTVRQNYESNGFPTVTRRSKGPQMTSQRAMAGFTSLIYRGIPWVADEKAPAGTVWITVQGKGDSIESAYDEAPTENTGFQWTGFMKPTNQYGTVGQIFLLGNFTTWQPRRHGRGTSVTGV
jgi:hypothetical protein